MNQLFNLIMMSLKVINYWLLVIPTKFSFFAFAGYNILIYLYFGEIDMNVVRDTLGGRGSFMYFIFILFIGIPYLLSFFSMLSMHMSTPGAAVNSALDRAIAYRNGQMSIKTPNEAYKIYKQTSHLDLMKSNSNSELGAKVARGFTAEMRNASPQDIYKKFVE
jgi:hypothetical protein